MQSGRRRSRSGLDVEATGWENVANRIPSGRVFQVLGKLVEGGALQRLYVLPLA